MAQISLESSFGAVANLSAAECDELIAFTQKTLDALNLKKLQTEQTIQKSNEKAVSIQTSIASTQAELDNLAVLLPTLPDGDIKQKFVDRKTKLEYTLYTLNSRSSASGNVKLSKSQGIAQVLELESQLYTDFKASVQSRKAAINP